MGQLMAKTARINDPDGMRRKIVDVAYRAFTGQGYNATAMQDLRDAADVSGGAFSHHFPTKKALGLTVIRDRIAIAVNEAWVEPVVIAPTAIAGIEAAFAGIIAQLDRNGSVTGCPLNNLAVELSGQDAELRQEMDQIFQSWRKAIEDKFNADFASGLMRSTDNAKLACLVVATYSGAMAMAKSGQSAEPLRACWHQLSTHLRRAYND
jgi:AcrR family transcriptional regulator